MSTIQSPTHDTTIQSLTQDTFADALEQPGVLVIDFAPAEGATQ